MRLYRVICMENQNAMNNEIKKLDISEINKFRSDIIETGLTRKLNEVIDVVNNILMKTPNPSEEKGLLNFLLEKGSKWQNRISEPCISFTVKELKDLLANGETPEVDNTVGQTILSDKELHQIRIALALISTNGNYIYTDDYIDYMMIKLQKLNGKPVETDKEESKYRLDKPVVNNRAHDFTLTNLQTNESKHYFVHSKAWHILYHDDNQKLLNFVFNNYKSSI